MKSVFRPLVPSLLFLLYTCLTVALLQGSVEAASPYSARAFVGETLEYVLKWGIVTAGHATLSASENGDGTCTYRVTARSTAIIDLVYPVRIIAESTVDCSTGRTMRYYKRAKEGFRRMREREVLFDWEKNEAQTVENGKIKRRLTVPEGTQDPISIYFAWRAGALGNSPRATITDGKRSITATVSIEGMEEVKVPAGRYMAQHLIPHLKGLAGVFKKSPDAKIEVWTREDDNVLLMLKSKVKVGHFSAKLTREKRP